MARRLAGHLRVLALIFLLGLAGLETAWGQTPGPGLENLTPEERAVAERNLERWQRMTPEERERITRNWERWRKMTPEERQQLRERWRHMTPEEREQLRERHRQEPGERSDRPRP